MDELKPEDELKPDASDRRPTRPRKGAAPAGKPPVSRQHMMMGIGILVLLLLVLGIGSALKGPDSSKPVANSASGTPPAPGAGKDIDLSGTTSQTGSQTTAPAATADASTASNGQQNIGLPPVSATPTQGSPMDTPSNQQRVTLPGDLGTALTNQQGQVDNAAGAQSSLPTAPATVSGSLAAVAPRPLASHANRPARSTQPEHVVTAPRSTQHSAAVAPRKETSVVRAPATEARTTHTTPARPALGTGQASSKGLPGGNYTLQLSGASRPESLNSWASKQNLGSYHVYKTTRNGEAWYVLVSGSYATPAEARRAVASLPADVRAKNPWVKPLSQVKKESGQ